MREITNCIVCGGGKLFNAIEGDTLLVKCGDCDLLQTHRINDIDYSQYNKPTSSDRSEKLLGILQKLQSVITVNPGDKVLDIGCGDGGFLGWYTKGIVTVGVDPSVYLIKDALKSHRADVAICDVFSASSIQSHFEMMGIETVKFKVITAIDILDLVQHPRLFLHSIKSLLHENGVALVQTLYLGSVLRDKMYKEITPDKMAYYLAGTLGQIVRDVGLEVSGAEFPKGVLRFYITHPGVDICKEDAELRFWFYRNYQFKLVEEIQARYDQIDTYKLFNEQMKLILEPSHNG